MRERVRALVRRERCLNRTLRPSVRQPLLFFFFSLEAFDDEEDFLDDLSLSFRVLLEEPAFSLSANRGPKWTNGRGAGRDKHTSRRNGMSSIGPQHTANRGTTKL